MWTEFATVRLTLEFQRRISIFLKRNALEALPFSDATDASEHHLAVRVIPKSFKRILASFKCSLPVNPPEANIILLERLLNQVEHLCPTAKHDTER